MTRARFARARRRRAASEPEVEQMPAKRMRKVSEVKESRLDMAAMRRAQSEAAAQGERPVPSARARKRLGLDVVHDARLADASDLAAIEARRKEPTRPFKTFVAQLEGRRLR